MSSYIGQAWRLHMEVRRGLVLRQAYMVLKKSLVGSVLPEHDHKVARAGVPGEWENAYDDSV